MPSNFHVGYVGKHYGVPVFCFYYGACNLFDVVGRNYAAHYVFVTVLVYHPAVGVLVHAFCYGEHFSQGNAVVLHFLGVQQYLVFLYVASQDGHLCHSSGREQARAYGPVGQRAQVEH